MEAKLKLDVARCKGCGLCISVCPKGAIAFGEHVNDKGYTTVRVDETLCVQCGACYRICPDYVFEILG